MRTRVQLLASFILILCSVEGCTFLNTVPSAPRAAEAPPVMRDVTSTAPASIPLGVSVPTPVDLFASAPEPTASLTCDEFFEALKADAPTTIEGALNSIRKKRPQYLKRSLYQYQTRMPLSDASWRYPRVVNYGGDAQMILTYGGHAHRPAFERIKALCFDAKQNQFDGYDLIFPHEADGPDALVDLTPEERAQNLVIAKGGRGTRQCASCHQESMHPIVDTFALWPGFYGAIDDGLKDQDRPDMRPTYATVEYNNWGRFQAEAASTGRYAMVDALWPRPNSDFTLKASYLNGRRIVSNLERLGPKFSEKKWEFARALFCAPAAPKKFFTQHDGDIELSANFGVLPEESDVPTQELFLGSYYDEMQKERRIADLLHALDLASPLPKEPFSSLRAYYRGLFKQRDLNLDLRLSTVDVDEVLLVRELKKVLEPLGVDLKTWSMVSGGAYVFENGTGGSGRVALRFILERPFAQTFLKDQPELWAALAAREAAENMAVRRGHAGAPEPAGSTAPVDQQNATICGLINAHVPAN